jgi:hypothetical protein
MSIKKHFVKPYVRQNGRPRISKVSSNRPSYSHATSCWKVALFGSFTFDDDMRFCKANTFIFILHVFSCKYNLYFIYMWYNDATISFSNWLVKYIVLSVLLFFFWPLCCLSFDLRILITPFVSSNSSYDKVNHWHIYLKFKRYCNCVLFQHIKLEK